MLYTKNGSYPQPQPDETPGWTEVIDKPDAPPGKEVVWWYPPGWVIRDPKPDDVVHCVWKWDQNMERWVLYDIHGIVEYVDAVEPEHRVVSYVVAQPSTDPATLQTGQLAALQTGQLGALK